MPSAAAKTNQSFTKLLKTRQNTVHLNGFTLDCKAKIGYNENMNKERETEILKILIRDKSATVKELSKTLYSSEPSIRRSLAVLAKEGLIRRTHGGAEFIGNESDNKIPFTVRALEDYNAKIAMAQKAAALVKDDFVIMLDGSSSAYNVIPFLKDKKN